MRRWMAAALLFLPTSFASALCTSLSVTNLTFGTYIGGAAVTTTATITINCSSGYAYTIGIGTSFYSASTSPRYMEAPPAIQNMTYGAYRDAAHTMNWGSNNGVDTVSGTGTGSNQTITIYGLIPAGQTLAPGNYADYPIVYVLAGPFVNLNPTATVAAGCNISAASLSFGTYTGQVLNGSSNLTIYCTSTTAYNIGLDAGTSTGATVTTRAMTGPASNTLPYQLFQSSAYTTNWGNTVGTDTVAGSGTGANQTVTVYGRVAAGAYPKPGSYSDTITVTVTY